MKKRESLREDRRWQHVNTETWSWRASAFVNSSSSSSTSCRGQAERSYFSSLPLLTASKVVTQQNSLIYVWYFRVIPRVTYRLFLKTVSVNSNFLKNWRQTSNPIYVYRVISHLSPYICILITIYTWEIQALRLVAFAKVTWRNSQGNRMKGEYVST